MTVTNTSRVFNAGSGRVTASETFNKNHEIKKAAMIASGSPKTFVLLVGGGSARALICQISET